VKHCQLTACCGVFYLPILSQTITSHSHTENNNELIIIITLTRIHQNNNILFNIEANTWTANHNPSAGNWFTPQGRQLEAAAARDRLSAPGAFLFFWRKTTQQLQRLFARELDDEAAKCVRA
jgi:hypothetical protein